MKLGLRKFMFSVASFVSLFALTGCLEVTTTQLSKGQKIVQPIETANDGAMYMHVNSSFLSSGLFGVVPKGQSVEIIHLSADVGDPDNRIITFFEVGGQIYGEYEVKAEEVARTNLPANQTYYSYYSLSFGPWQSAVFEDRSYQRREVVLKSMSMDHATLRALGGDVKVIPGSSQKPWTANLYSVDRLNINNVVRAFRENSSAPSETKFYQVRD